MKKTLINPESVASLRELSEPGKDFFCEMATLYLQQAPAKVSEIEKNLGERNFKGISGLAHQLKSSSANLGAMSLSDLFVRAEEAAKNRDLENLLRVVPEMKSIFQAVCAELAEISAGSVKQAS